MNIIVAEKKACTFTVNIKQVVRHDLILSSSNGCMPTSELSTEIKYYRIGPCNKQHSNDQWNFVKVKPVHQEMVDLLFTLRANWLL